MKLPCPVGLTPLSHTARHQRHRELGMRAVLLMLALPLVSVRCGAKVTAYVRRASLPTCMEGGVRVAASPSSSVQRTLSWTHTAAEAERWISELFPGTAGVCVRVSGEM